ncbi:hypothetical protein K523DRAFT_337872 [Schizophyllum commune Tattone D]|nr:hypothetical protein K523DRAFT_337872 [Schizophyllum commune Tattone D]
MDGIPDSRFVTRKDFLDTLLPVDAHVLNAVYQRATDQLFDKERGQWTSFPPEEEGFERGNLNEPFVKIANYIATTAREMAQITPENEGVVCEAAWMDCLAQPPAYLDKDTAPDLSLPGCALVMPVMVPLLDDPTVPADKKEKLWWMQLIAPVASKSYSIQTDESLVRQLLKYLRSIMAEQKDRRFVFGFTLSRSRVSVWLHDRSGAVGMDAPIDIHKDPKVFVHVISAVAILPAHRLGFDATMKLAREPLPPIHTYRLPAHGPDSFSAELYGKNAGELHWVIKMKSDTFMTTKALRDVSTDAVVGASSMAWAAIRYEDRYLDADKRTLLVVKQWWQHDDQADEGAIYEYLGDLSSTSSSPDPSSRYIGSMECCETVEIGGEVDSTDALIQRGLPTVPPPPDESAARKRVRRLHEAADSGWMSFKADPEKLARYYAGEQVNPLRNRTRKRLVMNVFGCSIKYFASLRELLTLMLQGVRGHQHAHNNGVLQRDVSPANLLITLLRTSDGSTTKVKDPECCLIDFGHASRIPNLSERIVPPPGPATEPLLPSMARELENITEAVAQRAYQFIRFRAPEARSPKSLGVIYISAALDYYEKWNGPLSSDATIEPGMFGWDDVPLLHRPVPLGLTEEQALRAPRVGNPSFASAQILNTRHVSVNRHFSGFRHNGVLHDAIHDMESFFWTLLYLCITRSGPGGGGRKELDGDVPDDAPDVEDVVELRRIVFCFFGDETETIAMNKTQLFSEPELFETGVLHHVHPYFEPLKPLLRQWWDLLLLAYEFEGYEWHGIHKFVIGLLEKALQDLPHDESEGDKERARRAKERRDRFVREVMPAGAHEIPRSPPSSSPVPTKKVKLL